VTIDLDVNDLKGAGSFQAELEERLGELTKMLKEKHKVSQVDFELRERRVAKSTRRGG
jgi:hypothetical protein